MKLAFAIAAVLAAAPTLAAQEPSTMGVGYICGAEQATWAGGGPRTGVWLTGVGNGGMRADTRVEAAQRWFDQGLNLYHAFNHNEARDAFAQAAAADPNCALCEWGVALGLGPTLNYGVTPAQ